MAKTTDEKVLVVGAGSMGVVTGYYLNQAGAQITFLIRPNRAKDLEHSQKLYCYDDNQLKTFADYKYVTDIDKIASESYDFIILTLDAASMMNEEGVLLVKSIGQATRGTKTAVLVGAIFPELKAWFLRTSGLPSEQVILAPLYIHIYQTKRLKLPTPPSVNQSLIDAADFAYRDVLGPSFAVVDSSPKVARSFVELYNKCGITECTTITPEEAALRTSPLFPVFAGCQLLGWPKYKDLDTKSEIWGLTIDAIKEIQELGIHGEAGHVAAQATTADSVAEMFRGMESLMLPLDFQGFNRFHHGGKVNLQDRQILDACLKYGVDEGKSMSALKDLIHRVEIHK